jgi:hypothetical protein
MNTHLTLSRTAEERELEKKRAELTALETELAQRELDLATLQAEVRAFESQYLKVVAHRYAELEEIETRIAEALGSATYQASPEAAEDAAWPDNEQLACGQARFHASEELKKLYREVARQFHPDLAGGEPERAHRHHLMIEANRAYETGSEERLQALLEAESSCPELARSSDVTAELVQVIRQLARVKERLMALDGEIAEITAAEIYKLKLRAEKAEAQGRDFRAELIAQVDRQIAKARNRLVHWQDGAARG